MLTDDPPSEAAISFTAQLLDSTHIVITFKSLPGNRPKDFGNVISIWRGGQQPWTQPPLATVAVDKNSPDGDMIIDLSTVQPPAAPPYIVAYGTSASGTAYCALQTLAPEGPAQQTVITQITAPYVGTDSIFAKFTTPPGNLPNLNQNWIGLWVGQGAMYDGTNRIAKFNVTSNLAEGSQGLNGLSLLFGTYYTLVYA